MDNKHSIINNGNYAIKIISQCDNYGTKINCSYYYLFI